MKSQPTIQAILITILLSCSSSLHAQPDSLWSRTYGGEFNDSLWAMIATADGGFALAGYAINEMRGADCYLVKLDADAEPVWAVTTGSQYRDEVHGLTQAENGNYAMTGITYDDEAETRSCFFWELDSAGDMESWTEYVGDGGYDDGYSIVALPDGDFAIGGVHYPGDEWHDDFMLREVEPGGNEDWFQHYGTEDAAEYGLSLIAVVDGEEISLILAGQKLVFDDEGIDYGSTLLLKTDEDGNHVWRREYPVEDGLSWAIDHIQTADGGFALVGGIGYADSGRGGITNWDAYLIKTDEEGQMEWSQEIDLEHDEWGMGLIQLGDGGFVLTGMIGDQNEEDVLENADLFLMRTDEAGEILWTGIYGGDGHDFGGAIFPTDDGGYLIGGTTSSIGNGGTDFWLLKTGRDPVSVPPVGDPSVPDDIRLLSVYPNPFNSTTTIRFTLPQPGPVSLAVYDVLGRRVRDLTPAGWFEAGENNIMLNARNLSSGNYIIIMESEPVTFSRMITVEK